MNILCLEMSRTNYLEDRRHIPKEGYSQPFMFLKVLQNDDEQTWQTDSKYLNAYFFAIIVHVLNLPYDSLRIDSSKSSSPHSAI